MQRYVGKEEWPVDALDDRSEQCLMERCGQLLMHQRTLTSCGNSDEFDALQKADRASEELHALGFEVADIKACSIYGLAAKAMFVMEHCEAGDDDLAHVLARSLSRDVLALARQS
jgi:hypothetical protein